MVSGSLNGKADPEGSCAEDIVDVGEKKGKSYRSYYKRGGTFMEESHTADAVIDSGGACGGEGGGSVSMVSTVCEEVGREVGVSVSTT